MVTPLKLQPNDEIRVIAPARQASIIGDDVLSLAKTRLEKMGFRVSFGKNIFEGGIVSSSVETRVADFYAAFQDPEVKAVMSIIGGFNSNELLPFIDYELIKNNPKLLMGHSDITALQNALYAQTGLVCYSGPHFSSFGEKIGFEYTLEYFKRAVLNRAGGGGIEIVPSAQWSADRWYKNQDKRVFINNPGPVVIQEGEAEGVIVGGNLCTLNLLQGTPYMPSLKGAVLFLEEDQMGLSHIGLFIRNLVSLMQQPDFSHIKGIVFGRFHPGCDIDDYRLQRIVNDTLSMPSIPVISGVDFGHTEPRVSFPIGGGVKMQAAKSGQVSLTVTD